MVLRRLFDEKLKAGEILLLGGGTASVHEALFSRHQDQEKGDVMMGCHSTAGAELATPEGEPSVEAMS